MNGLKLKNAVFALLLLALTLLSSTGSADDKEANTVYHRVTVINGYSDRGTAPAGERVYIYSRTPSGWDNRYFDYWYSESDGVIFENRHNRRTSFIMPNHPVTVVAEFRSYYYGNGFTVGGGCASLAPSIALLFLPLALIKFKD